MEIQADDSPLLASLAMAMVERPRSTLMELAKAVGISKATLYRYCRTRDALVARLMAHSLGLLTQAMRAAQLDASPPLDALRRLNANYLEHRELIAFLVYFRREKYAAKPPTGQSEWEVSLDRFFLRGQREGAFRIDIPAPGLTELWASSIVGLVDAERRGRVARAGLAELIEQAFLEGVSAR
ncbi:TetR/AcrR family transcriptional regulator [Pseudomonas sp. C11]|uniref:TetR/AcrR family transcriptional regulator n=1 Tax=Pseudomonas sp. C11 TaxID=3075550 RepID=UPI002AFEEF4E|nr:TetR/AcrR family transcriptional regulator [Pseudomonas sp. C11]